MISITYALIHQKDNSSYELLSAGRYIASPSQSIKGLKDHATQRIRLPSLGARITSNICPPSVQGKFVVYLSLSTPGCLFCSRLIRLASFRIGQSSKFVTNLAKYHSFFARSVSHAMLWIRCHPLVLAAK